MADSQGGGGGGWGACVKASAHSSTHPSFYLSSYLLNHHPSPHPPVTLWKLQLSLINVHHFWLLVITGLLVTQKFSLLNFLLTSVVTQRSWLGQLGPMAPVLGFHWLEAFVSLLWSLGVHVYKSEQIWKLWSAGIDQKWKTGEKHYHICCYQSLLYFFSSPFNLYLFLLIAVTEFSTSL